MNRSSPLPSTSRSRMLQFGRLAGGIAAGMAAEGVRKLASGNLPSTGELLLTPGNAARIGERLSELRGAAMKVGQLISMEAGDLLPPELTIMLARLREDAHRMPLGQVASVLDTAWGEDWPKSFKRFNFKPIAAASIGQVHEAITRQDERLAIKIQYPGVRDSIDSDVDNVARILSLFRALPDRVNFAPLLEEAKRQLHQEADYLHEAAHLGAYRTHLADDERFEVPRVLHEQSTREVLSMSYVTGVALEDLRQEPRRIRDRVSEDLLELALRELFDWGLVQTDPNFANYRYDPDSGRIGLLDFGAVRRYPPEKTQGLRRLLKAGIRRDSVALAEAAEAVGYTQPEDPTAYRDAVTALLLDATEPARHGGGYSFAGSELAGKMNQKVMSMRFEAGCWRLPSPDLLFLHRKLGGLYMLCARLRARVPVDSLLQPYLED